MPATRRTGRGALHRETVRATVRETSAGGLVVRGSGRLAEAALIGRIDRRGRLEWVLPKGHLEPGETPEQAALREIVEETGLLARIVGRLGTITYWFVADGQRINKQVHHYLMRHVGGELSDADPEVADIAWVPLPAVPGRLRYDSERDLVRRLPELLGGSAAQPARPAAAGLVDSA